MTHTAFLDVIVQTFTVRFKLSQQLSILLQSGLEQYPQ